MWFALCAVRSSFSSLCALNIAAYNCWKDHHVEDSREKQICHISFNWVISKSEMRHLVSLLGRELPISQSFSWDVFYLWHVKAVRYSDQLITFITQDWVASSHLEKHTRTPLTWAHTHTEEKVCMRLNFEVTVPRTAQTDYCNNYEKGRLIS